MAEFVKFEVPNALARQQLELLEKVRRKGKVKIGVNEVTKAVERGVAKLVLIAQDVSPAELVMHLPLICDEKNVPYSYVPNRKELGEKVGVEVPTATIAVVEEGDAKKELEEIAKKLVELKKK